MVTSPAFGAATDGSLDEARDAAAAVHVGLYASAVRCLLTYVIAPALGAVGVVLGPLGLVLQLAGAVTASYGARRLWALRHPLRWPYAALAVTLAVLTVAATAELVVRVVR